MTIQFIYHLLIIICLTAFNCKWGSFKQILKPKLFHYIIQVVSLSHIYCIKLIPAAVSVYQHLCKSNQQTTIKISEWNQELDLWPPLLAVWVTDEVNGGSESPKTDRRDAALLTDKSVYSGAAAGVTEVTEVRISALWNGNMPLVSLQNTLNHYHELILDFHTL